MEIYHQMFLKIFNQVTDAIVMLREAQSAAEEMYLGHLNENEEQSSLNEDVPENEGNKE